MPKSASDRTAVWHHRGDHFVLLHANLEVHREIKSNYQYETSCPQRYDDLKTMNALLPKKAARLAYKHACSLRQDSDRQFRIGELLSQVPESDWPTAQNPLPRPQDPKQSE